MGPQFWNQRYSERLKVYGDKPNVFLAETLSPWKPGKLLLPAEGEGRNAQFCIEQGWCVEAFDYSEVACSKMQECIGESPLFSVREASLESYHCPHPRFDVIAFIFVPMHEEQLEQLLTRYASYLKPGGRIILEAFTKEQVNNSSGGPKDPAYLLSEELVRKIQLGLQLDYCKQLETVLDEGPFHQGKAAVVRAIWVKVS
jgi:cyclopropane fatty-acyl-phospholipid synthase-like methyltransferase